MSAAWDALARELDGWSAAGLTATLWWRDDDAFEPSPALDRLLGIAGDEGAPLALSVIPARARGALGEALAGHDVALLQHGYDHRDHAEKGERRIELADHRPAAEVAAELALGRRRLRALGARVLPVLVPPWNRIGGTIVPTLSALGYRGLSALGPRAARAAAPGLVQANVHIDLVAWEAGRRFVGREAALAQAVKHLAARRAGAVDADEPTGLMTHHAVMDDDAFAFVAAFIRATRRHAAARWLDAEEVFAPLTLPSPPEAGGEGCEGLGEANAEP